MQCPPRGVFKYLVIVQPDQQNLSSVLFLDKITGCSSNVLSGNTRKEKVHLDLPLSCLMTRQSQCNRSQDSRFPRFVQNRRATGLARHQNTPQACIDVCSSRFPHFSPSLSSHSTSFPSGKRPSRGRKVQKFKTPMGEYWFSMGVFTHYPI